ASPPSRRPELRKIARNLVSLASSRRRGFAARRRFPAAGRDAAVVIVSGRPRGGATLPGIGGRD
ncbi:MAG: hypothetical protein AAGI51_11830, partial [Pseudomonadota bacterium]